MFKNVYQDTGSFHPAHLTKPTLRGDCLRYYEAFCHLGVARLWNQAGPQPIQVSEVEALMRMLGIKDPETQLKYLRLIRIMDSVERAFLNEQMKKAKQ